MFLADQWQDYEVLDCGGGEKLERWGDVYLRRPDPQAIWPARDPSLWRKAQAHYHRSEKGGGSWEFFTKLPDRWVMNYKNLRFYVRPTGFKHTGLFPEQATNWDWMTGLVSDRVKQGREVRVLNLFAYTGGATIACAAAGAQVCHCDAAKGMVQWARENRECSGLPEDRVRWIIDDALKFVQREARRGRFYDGILMDPPSYGRGPGGEVWKLENELYGLARSTAYGAASPSTAGKRSIAGRSRTCSADRWSRCAGTAIFMPFPIWPESGWPFNPRRSRRSFSSRTPTRGFRRCARCFRCKTGN